MAHATGNQVPAIQAASFQEMAMWFLGPLNVPQNPLLAAMNATSGNFDFDPLRTYTEAGNSVYQQPWPDTKDDTRKREILRFVVTHGDEQPFDAVSNPRSVSPQIAANVASTNQHWATKIKKNGAELSTWQEGAAHLTQITTNDARGEMVTPAKKVWEALLQDRNLQDMWQQQDAFPDRLVRMMRYYLAERGHDTPRLVKFFLGARIRPTFDVDALYAASQPHWGYDANGNAFDVCPILREWLELSCAHMLVEVLRWHILTVANGAPKNPAEVNGRFKILASTYPNRDFLMRNMDRFPIVV